MLILPGPNLHIPINSSLILSHHRIGLLSDVFPCLFDVYVYSYNFRLAWFRCRSFLFEKRQGKSHGVFTSFLPILLTLKCLNSRSTNQKTNNSGYMESGEVYTNTASLLKLYIFLSTFSSKGSQDNTICIVTRLRAEWLRNCVSLPSRELWNSPTIVFQ